MSLWLAKIDTKLFRFFILNILVTILRRGFHIGTVKQKNIEGQYVLRYDLKNKMVLFDRLKNINLPVAIDKGHNVLLKIYIVKKVSSDYNLGLTILNY